MPRRASVNSFGYGGTNGHAILEDPALFKKSPSIPRTYPKPWQVLVLSGKDQHSTKRMLLALRDYLLSRSTQNEQVFLLNLAYTLNNRRSRFPWKAVVSISDTNGLIATLESPNTQICNFDGKPRLGFVFTGQGAQWHAMGRELLSTYSVFKQSILEAEQILKDFGCSWSAVGK